MKKAALLIWAATFPIWVWAADWQTIIKPVAKQVPRLEVLQAGDDSPGICSGVVLDAARGFLLTAAHCVPGKVEELSITVNGRHAEVARVNRLLDLAVLRFAVKGEQTLVLAAETPPAGAEIAVVGYLLGSKNLHVQFGRIAARRNEDGAVVLDSVTLPGDSGGAIIDASGHLIAMTNQYYRGTSVGLAVPVEVLRDFVEPYLPK